MKKLILLSIISVMSLAGSINADVNITIKNETGKYYRVHYGNGKTACYSTGSWFSGGKSTIKLPVANGATVGLAFYRDGDCSAANYESDYGKQFTVEDNKTYTLKCADSGKYCGKVLIS